MEKQLYNLYENGNLIMKDAPAERIIRAAGRRFKQGYYADKGVLFKGIYKVERSRLEQDYDEIRVKRRMLQTWEQLIEPFRHVIWVTEPGRNVKVLNLKKE